MADRPARDLISNFQLFAKIASSLVIVIALTVIFGWYSDIAIFKSILPNLVTMKFNTALAFLLTGISMRLFFFNPQEGISYKHKCLIAYILSAIVFLIGAGSLSEYIFSWDLGIDQLFVRELPGAVQTSNLGRMAPTTAVNFILIGIMLLLFNKKAKRFMPYQVISFAVGAVAFLTFVAYLYSVKALYGFSRYTTMAAHTAFLFLLISFGTLCIRPEGDLMAVSTSRSFGGFLFRRLSATFVMVLVLLGWLELLGWSKGYYVSELGMTLFVIIGTIIGLVIIYFASRRVYLLDIVRENTSRELEASVKIAQEKTTELTAKLKELEELKAAVLNVNDDLGLKQAELIRAEESLSYEKERLAVTLNSIGDGVIATDTEGRITLLNGIAEMHTGWPKADAVGRPLEEVFNIVHEKTRQRCVNPVKMVLEKGEIIGLANHTILIARDGTEKVLADSAAPIRDSKGNIIGVVLVFRDVTAQSKVDEQVRELSTAVEQGPAVVVITGPEGEIQYVNAKFTQVTGYSFQEASGKNPRILKSDEQPVEFYKNLWDTIKSGREWRGEFHNKKKNGQLYWEAASISPIKDADGAITHFIAIKEDITARKATEDALVKANEQLMKLDQLKSDFVSTVSHELRTPLSITREGISLVIDDIPGKINDKQKEILLTSRDNIDLPPLVVPLLMRKQARFLV